MSFIGKITKKRLLERFGYPLPKWFKGKSKEVVEPEVWLDEGDVICDICKGWGRVERKLCPKCFGNRKLDWIENILGVSCTSTSASTSTSTSTTTESSYILSYSMTT